MKKSLTLTLALVALAAFTGPSVGQGATTIHGSRSNGSYRTADVTKVNPQDKTFTAIVNGKEVTFSAKTLRTLPAVGDVIDVNYTQTTPNGPMVAMAVTVKGTHSNGSSFRTADAKASPKVTNQSSENGTMTSYRAAASTKVMTGDVTKVNAQDKTFTVTANGKESTFDAKNLKAPPAVGDVLDVNYTQTTPNGPMVATATTVKGTRSNGSDRVLSQEGRTMDKDSPQMMTGRVTKVNPKYKNFTVMTKEGKEVTFDATELKALPDVGRMMDVTYTKTTPNGPFKAINLNSSRSNVD